MTFLSRIFPVLFVAATLAPTQAAAQKPKNIYTFAFGTSFNDSTVFLSAPVMITGAQVDGKTGFLDNRRAYSEQFKQYLDKVYANSHTCTVFFAKNSKSIEKKYLKLRKFYHLKKNRDLKLVEIPASEFQLSLPLPVSGE